MEKRKSFFNNLHDEEIEYIFQFYGKYQEI